ncbi:hypothetical protein EL22_13555 [Halostagnicola sp. A56]|uniref:hypothetical protein n=1 Tax=Halostagnicola sp. A56 TaxID=1495067 RepID=UPI00049FC3A3|nr:hypothetical protein [Halostagnicola sp. A56]KDE57257.1 hypothetical protein EL22_13555 [Halostagnicola sp. A56]
MSSNVFLVSSDSEPFARTVLSEVDLTDYPDRPEELAESESARFWGVEADSSAETYFEKMDEGDLLLFYREGEYVGTGRIGTTFVDDEEWASATVWDDSPRTLIYTIEDFTATSVPKAAVNTIFEYSDGYNPNGLIRVADNRVDNTLEAIELAVQQYD